MDDVIEKIKKAEEEARQILENAELEAKKIVLTAKENYQKNLDRARKEIKSGLNQKKEQSRLQFEAERMKQLDQLYRDFISQLKPPDQSRKESLEILKKLISSRFGIDV